MATQRRKDNKNRVLREGEYQRANGTYRYRWLDNRPLINIRKMYDIGLKRKCITISQLFRQKAF